MTMLEIDDPSSGEVMVAAGAVSSIVTVAVAESAVPAAFDARTQYEVVSVRGGVVKPAEVSPARGVPVSPLSPAYH
jgi:hypothetical protein